MIRAALLLAAVLALPAQAQTDPAAQARDAAAQLRAAAARLDEAEQSFDRVAALTRVIRGFEAGLGAMRDSLRAARLRETRLADDFVAESDRVGAVIAALTSIGQAPEVTLLLHPAGPEATARAGMLMRDVTPAMLGQVEEIRSDLREIAMLRALQDTALDDFEQGLQQWQSARTRLAAAIEARSGLPRRIVEDEGAMTALARSTETLTEFAEMLAALPEDAISAGMPEFGAARGNLELPVSGQLLRGFNETDRSGVERPGWTLAAAPGALVTSPWPATIRYRGPLLDYGNVIILEPEAGYLMVFAGLDALYGATGDVVPAGAPVGVLPGGSPEMAGFDADGGTQASETLYVEVRRDGEAEDPASWFRPDQG